MNAITTRMGMFPSRYEAWRTARAFIERFCGEAGVARETCLRTNLVAEELFLNTVKHGHRGGSDAPVWITLSGDSAQVALVFEDNAPPFNPFGRPTQELLQARKHAGSEGGLGVILAHGLTASADYAYLFGRNRIRLTIA